MKTVWKRILTSRSNRRFTTNIILRKASLEHEYNIQAMHYYVQGELAKAENCYLDALKTAQKDGNQSLEFKILSELGAIRRLDGNYKQAEMDLKNALNMAVKNKGMEDSCNMIMAELALVAAQQGNIAEAQKQMEKVVNSCSDKIQCEAFYQEFGMILYGQGLVKSAMKQFKKALEMLESIGELYDFVGTSMILHNLATCYSDLGDYETAMKYHKKALDITGSIYGEESIEYAVSLESVATEYIKMKEIDEAAKCWAHAQDILDAQHFGTQECNKLEILLLVAKMQIEAERNNLNESLKLGADALKLASQASSSAGKVGVLYYLATIYERMGDYDTALKMLDDSSTLLTKERLPPYPNLALITKLRAQIYYKIGDLDKAEQYHSKIIEMYRKSLGVKNKEIVSMELTLGEIYFKQGKFKNAELILVDALLSGYLQGTEYISACKLLAESHFKQGKFGKAAAWYQRVLPKITDTQEKAKLEECIKECNIRENNTTLSSN